MNIFINSIVGFVTLLHLYFLILEMFLWATPFGLRAFGQTLEQAKRSSVLAANQGLYNGFLAAGLIWSLAHPNAEVAWQLKIFFLSCIVVAGIYGGYSVSKRILFIQALPAAIALVLLMIR